MKQHNKSYEVPGKRLSIILSEQSIKRIDHLKAMTATSSTTDVIKTAVLTYEALAEFLQDGNSFYLKKTDSDQFTPVAFLFDIKQP